MQNKKNMLVGLVVVLLVVGLGLVLRNKERSKGYSVVYLVTGEVYIGKLTRTTFFHSLKLRDSYILQVTKDATDPNKNNFQLTPIKEALWAPTKLVLTRKNVVFYGPLTPESAIAKKLAEQKN